MEDIMSKVFSFIIIFISFSVFAHSNFSQDELIQARGIYARESAESKRLGDRTQLFCSGFGISSISSAAGAQGAFRRACEDSEVDDIVKLRERRESINQQMGNIQDNSSEYQEYLRYHREFDELEYGRNFSQVLSLINKNKGVQLPERVRLSAIQVDEAWRKWIATPQSNTWEELRTERESVHANLEDRCKQEKNDSKITKALEDIESTQNNCTEAKENYLSHLPQLYEARRNLNQQEEHFQEHLQQEKGDTRGSTSGDGDR